MQEELQPAVLFVILVLCKTVGSAHSLRIPFGIESGPEALLGLTCLNCFSRPFYWLCVGHIFSFRVVDLMTPKTTTPNHFGNI
jgi:hypothetical protein